MKYEYISQLVASHGHRLSTVEYVQPSHGQSTGSPPISWTMTLGGKWEDHATGVASGKDDNVYLSGSFQGNITLASQMHMGMGAGPQKMISRGFADGYLAKV